MGEKMTLEQLKHWARNQVVLDDVTEREQKQAIAAIDALTQPAQAVDVGAIQRVIDELRGYCDASDDSCYGTLSTSLVREYADKLTAALPKDSNGSEGVGE